MANKRPLKIISKLTVDLSTRTSCDLALSNFFLCSLPLLCGVWFSSLVQQSNRADTAKLKHDIKIAFPPYKIFPSSWYEHDFVISTSTFVEASPWNDISTCEWILIYIDWPRLLRMLYSLVKWMLRSEHCYIVQNYLIIKRKWKRYMIFLCLATVVSFTLVAATDGTLQIVYNSLKDNWLEWVEKSVVEADSNFKGLGLISEGKKHPLTMGKNAPYYLDNEYRYHKEDAVLLCTYPVPGMVGVNPIKYVLPWWKKNGVSIELNKRIYVNVSYNYELMQPSCSCEKYLIQSKLTIEMVDSSDYGVYTCGYVIPDDLTFDMRVCRNHVMESLTMSKQIPEADVIIGPIFKSVYYSTFILQKSYQENIKVVKVSPGGILIDVIHYMTVASDDDILTDVTLKETSKYNLECCSLTVKLYWILFRDGCFVDLPLSRQIRHEGFDTKITAVRWICICPESFGIHSFKLYREHFNEVDGKTELIDIEYPVKLKLEPVGNVTFTFFQSLPFCSSVSYDSYDICRILDFLLENPIYTVYAYDVVTGLMLVFAFVFVYMFAVWSKDYIIKPLRRCCFNLFHEDLVQFPAINGPPLLLNFQTDEEEVGAKGNNEEFKHIDIYLSYNEEEDYDTKVAMQLKDMLLGMGLKVFDVQSDVLPGHHTSSEISLAIRNSSRFVVIASKAYIDDDEKRMEFFAIQDTIIAEDTSPQNRLLVFMVEPCEINGLHRAPCIHVPQDLKGNFELDQGSLNRFKEWEIYTRPTHKGKPPHPSFLQQLFHYGFSMVSVLIIIILIKLALSSTIFK